VNNRRSPRIVVATALVLVAGCAPKMTTQQALVEEAFEMCRAQGRSAELDRVDRDGTFSVVGRESDAKRVHDCMVRYAESSRRPASAGGVAPAPAMAAPAPAPPPASTAPAAAASAPPASGLMASRLPGTWRGTLKMPPRASGEAEIASPATLSFVVAAGSLRWTLAATVPGLAADGTAVVVDGELRMTGTVRNAGARPSSTEPSRSGVTVRYAGTMVGDRLEVTGVTTDKQVHVLSIRRVGE
jgi:hypothetical protein